MDAYDGTKRRLGSIIDRYRSLVESGIDVDDICIDCGAHEEQACEFDCLTRRLATEEDVTDDSNG